MKRNVAIALTMLVSAMLPSPVSAQKSILQEVEATPGKALLPQRVDHLGVRATLLHWGMSTGDVERIMGAPAQADSSGSQGNNVRILKYPAEPIATAVTITDDRLSGVALDIAGIAAQASEPPNAHQRASYGRKRRSVR